MGKVFIEESTLTAIGDSIRAKTGGTDLIAPGNMATEIAGITTGYNDQLISSEYPDYISPEVIEIMNKVKSVQTDESITFIAMSDTHHPANITSSTGASSLQANMAMKIMPYLFNVDFVTHLGDISNGGSTDTPETLQAQIESFNEMFVEAGRNIPMFLCIGNHDAGIYYHSTQNSAGNTGTYTMTGEYIYNNFTKYSESDDTVISGVENGGYCYRDFADKKLRVFMLNTSEKLIAVQNDQSTYGVQRVWLANALLDLNSKTDAADWGFIILCHYPADYGENMPMSQLLEAYVKGTSFTIKDPVTSYYVGDQTNETVNFTGNNSAKFIAQFHGHIHNFLYSKLHSNVTGSVVEYEAWRVCTPNGQVNRENTYTTIGGVNFAEGTSYAKTVGTAEGTSFVVNVINPSEEKIYSFCYGAGTDRTIGYGGTSYYSINTTFTNVTSSNNAVSVEEGESYTTTLTIADGCAMSEIVITMGGEDITTSVYDGSVIDIPEVTGHIVITAIANKIPTSNLRLKAQVFTNGDTSIYNNGLGYKNGYRLSGNAPSEYETAATGYVMTGCIPWDGATPITVSGATIVDTDGNCRLYLLNSTKDYVFSPWIIGGTSATFSTKFTIENLGTNKYRLTPISSFNTSTTYFAMSLKGSGEDLIITIGDESADVSEYYTITNNLVNVETNNLASSIEVNSEYSALLRPTDGYELTDVTVTMGGVNVTDIVYADAEINISPVTGNIVINAVATIIQSDAYTNLIPLSTTTYNGTELYNPPYGYKTGYRRNSSNVEVAATNMCCTGYMPLNGTNSNGDVIRIKNVTIAGGSTPYFAVFNENGTLSGSLTTSQLTSGGTNGNLSCVVEDGVITITVGVNSMYACWLSCGVIDDTSIITLNEDIVEGKTYKNLVLESTDSSGAIYNGTGYKQGYRLNSSGTETESTVCACSGFIPFTYGDVIRVWGTCDSTPGSTGNYIAFYDSTHTKLQVVAGQKYETYGTWEALDDGYLWTFNSNLYSAISSATFIRVSMCGLSSGEETSLTVTLNQEIT